MNDETKSAESNPELPPRIRPASALPARPLSYWLKRLFVCNPFFLASAALLLYGMYRVSMDPTFLATEIGQLTFNFTSLQLYELLLAGTVMLLAARRIWYDATMLVVLENLLVLVPFILVSHAALIEPRTVWTLCLLAALLVVGRTFWLRRRAGELMPPMRALICGAAVLALNTALPIVYRHFHETKFGTKLAAGAAYEFNEFSWFWLLPALAALANLLPRPGGDRSGAVVRRWFPLVLFLFWLGGTGVHLFSLGYVYDFDLRPEQLAPVLWVLAWTLSLRVTDFVATPAPALRTALLFGPLLATLIPMQATGSRVFFILSTFNVVGYALVLWTQRNHRLALHLTLVSFAAAFAALPREVLTPLLADFDRVNFIGAAALVYLMICAVLSRNPKLAILGGIAAALAGGLLRGAQGDTLHWAAQAGFAYFLLHSLRWHDDEHQGAAGVRTFIAAVWLVQSFLWVREEATFWHPLAPAGVVLLAWWLRGFIFQNWSAALVPVAAGLVAVCSPVNFTCGQLHTAPVGVLAIVGSFVLFAVGTAVALTRHRWHKNGLH
jgi:hypothetical protein